MDSTRTGLLVLACLVASVAFVAVDRLGIVGEGDTVPISRFCIGGGANAGVWWRAVAPAEGPFRVGERVVVAVPGRINHHEARVAAVAHDSVTLAGAPGHHKYPQCEGVLGVVPLDRITGRSPWQD